MKQPLISIVLTLYDKADYIEDQIFSIYQQTYTNRELIIVDDCSTDGSFEKAKNFCKKLCITEKCTFLQNPENIRLSKTFENGLKHIKGERVAICDADDIWLKNKLEMSIHYILKHPEKKLVYGDMTTIDENNLVLSKNFYKNNFLLSIANRVAPYPMAIAPTILFSAEPIKELLKIGFTNRKLAICQDYRVVHFFVLFYGRTSIAYLNQPLIYYRRTSDCMSISRKKTKTLYIDQKHQMVKLCDNILSLPNYNPKNKPFILQMKLVNQKLESYISGQISFFSLLFSIIKTGNMRRWYLVFQYWKDVR